MLLIYEVRDIDYRQYYCRHTSKDIHLSNWSGIPIGKVLQTQVAKKKKVNTFPGLHPLLNAEPEDCE